MNPCKLVAAPPRLVLAAGTAADLMTANPVSIREAATVHDALRLLTHKHFSAAAVIDEAGRPVGVLSQSDLLIHQREGTPAAGPADATVPGEDDAVRVRDLMTPAVFSVPPDAPAARVVREMLGLHVHRLFVVGRDGVLVGVITALDVLRHLQEAELP